MKVLNSRARSIRFFDLAQFSSGEADMKLVDIINDVTKERFENDFLGSPGAFVYELDLALDAHRAFSLDMESFAIEFYLSDPRKKMRTTAGSRRSKVEQRRALRHNFVAKNVSPFMSLDAAFDLGLPSPGFQFALPPLPPPPIERVVLLAKKPETIGALEAALITAEPIGSQTRSNEGSQQSSTGPLEPAGLTMEQAIREGADPMGFLQAPDPQFPNLSARTGLGSSMTDLPVDPAPPVTAFNNIRVKRSLADVRAGLASYAGSSSSAAIKLAASLAGNASPSLGSKRVLGYKAVVRNNKQRIRHRVEIPKGILGDRKRFFIKITPTARQSVRTLKWTTTTVPFVFAVSHMDKVRDFFDPQAAPEFTVIKNAMGYVVLKVRQVDPTATSITVLRRTYNPRKEYKVSLPTKIAEVKTMNGQMEHVIIDSEVTNCEPNNTMYMAIARGPTGLPGPAKGLVVKGLSTAVVTTAEDEPNHLSIVAKNDPEGVEIKLANFPTGIIAVRLLREELSKTGDLYARVVTIPALDSKTLVMTPHSGQLLFIDHQARPGVSYRYFASMRPKFGSEFISAEDELLIRVIPTKPLPVDVSVANVTVTIGASGQPKVEMDLLSTPRNNDIDFVLRLLRETGVSNVFIDEIDRQRSTFAELAVFIVERVNRITGRRESFGIQPPGAFSDNASTRAGNNVSALEYNTRYSYFVKVCIRPPEALLRSVFTKFSSTAKPGIDDKEALAQVFLSAYASQFGNSPGGALPSTSDLINGISISDNLRSGETGIVLEADVTIPDNIPRPSNLVGRQISDIDPSRVLLQWTITAGDVSEIYCCVVVVTINGQQVVIGTAVSDGDSEKFTFIDKIYGFQPGKVVYAVKLVYRDLSVSERSNTVSFYNHSYTPPGLMDGDYLGVVNKLLPATNC